MDILHPRPAASEAYNNSRVFRHGRASKPSKTTSTTTKASQTLLAPPPPPRTAGTATTETGSSYLSMLESHMIKVPLTHWPHFFAPGEGIRDSIRPGRLRVTNPDALRTYSAESIPQLLAPDSRLQPGGIRQVRSRDGAEGHQSIIASLHNIGSTDSGTTHASDSPHSDTPSQPIATLPSSLAIVHPTAATVLLARSPERPTTAPPSSQANAPPSTTVLTPPTPTAPQPGLSNQTAAQQSPSLQQRPKTPLDPLQTLNHDDVSHFLQPPAAIYDRENPTSARSSTTSSRTRISSTMSDPFDLDAGRSVDLRAVSPLSEHGDVERQMSERRSSVSSMTSRRSSKISNSETLHHDETEDEPCWQRQWRDDVGLYEGT